MEEDLIIEIGRTLKRAAQEQDGEWDYAGYMFETKDGVSSGGEMFCFRAGVRVPYRLGRDMKTITTAFKRLREVTRVDGDDYWIKVLFVLRADGEMKFLFEFDDWDRWKITPANVDRAYEILVGDVFPDALAH